jgi:endo-1,4-beta-xylanase
VHEHKGESKRRRPIALLGPVVALAMAAVTSAGLVAPPAAAQGDSQPITASTEERRIGRSLGELGSSRQLLIGAAAEPHLLPEAPYSDTLARELTAITPRKAMKWEQIHPERQRYDFVRADALVEFAERNAMQVRGQSLVWHMQNPPWLYEMPGGREEFLALLRDHIFAVARDGHDGMATGPQGDIEAHRWPRPSNAAVAAR